MSRISNSLTTVLTNLLTMMFRDECLYCPVPVPMEVLFAPQKEQARLSSDGQFLAYLGPSAAEVSNVVGSNLVRVFSFVNNKDMC